MIICLEGPSAVGKTTVASALADQFGAAVIPEVNILFTRPAQESATWYFERQVQRWKLALQENQTHRFVVLDGDPFQPLWYNWAYNYIGWQGLDVLSNFYQEQVNLGHLAFPNIYYVLSADEADLSERKARDKTRARRGFEKHLLFVLPQKRYFEAMQQFCPSRVAFVPADTINSAVAHITALLRVTHVSAEAINSVDLFSQMIEWIRYHKPA